MKRVIATLLCAATAGSGGVAMAGCGDEVPADAVAKVGDTVISKADFDRWVRITAGIEAHEREGRAYDPQDEAACVAARRSDVDAKDEQPSAPRLRMECRRERRELKSEVMELLVREQWVTREAAEQGVQAGDAAVRRSLREIRTGFFQSPKEYRELLDKSGMTRDEFLLRLRVDLLEARLRDKAVAREGRVTDEAVRGYYRENRETFAVPERRVALFVATRTKRRAEQAKVPLARGESWRRVARNYSAGEAGDYRMRVTREKLDGALERALFDASVGRLVGPVRSESWWYVLEVRSVRPGRQRPLSQVAEEIRETLRSERRARAIERFEQAFYDEYREITTCAGGYLVPECENGPDEAEEDEEA